MPNRSRVPLVAGNWKMNLSAAEAVSLVQALRNRLDDRIPRVPVQVVVCPSFLSIPRVVDALRESPIEVGAQDCFWLAQGAFTGQVSPTMLTACGVRWCIVGHSETRGRFGKVDVPESTLTYFGETDETVNLKLHALIEHGLHPILCVGESLAEREAGRTDAVITGQLEGALADFDPAELLTLAIAYEPVWAIGTGHTCDAAEANRICGLVRAFLADKAGSDVAERVRVLYGGSVKASNAHELFSQPEIDGGLVGGASLSAEEFERIVLSTPVHA